MAEAWESAPEVAAPAAAAPWESAPELGAAPPSGDLRSLANAAADRHGIPQHIFRGLVSAESSWDPRAQPRDANGNLRSSAKGLTQLIDSTAAEVGVSDAFDPMQNLEGGARYLRALHDHFGDWDTAIAAYHDGPQKVMDAGITPDTGQPYLDRVRRHASIEEGRQPETPGQDLQPPGDLGRAIDASLAAHSATNGTLSPDQGAEALDLAQRTGLGPAFVAGTLPAVKQAAEQKALKATLAQAPLTASFMAQSPAHAAAAKDDTDQLSTLEWIFGRYSQIPPNAVGGTIEEPGIAERALGSLPGFDTLFAINRDFDENFENVIPSALAAYYSKGIFGLRAALLGLKAGTVGLTESDKANLAQAQEFAEAPVPGTKGHLAREMVGASVEAVPQLAGFMGGTWAAAPFLLTQTYGQMHNQFAAQKGADGVTPKYSENEVRGLSLGGAVATTTLLAGVAGRFAKSTVGVMGKLLPASAQRALARTGADSLVKRLLDSPNLADKILGRYVQFQESALHGLGFMFGMGVVNDLTDQVGDVMTGGKYDVSKSVQRASQSVEGAMMLLPMMAAAPMIGFTSDVGRAWKARSDGLDVAAQVAAAKDSKFIKRAPEQAKKLLEAQAAQDPARGTAYIPVAAFDEAMRIAGLDPREAAKALLGDDGAAHHEAQATDGELAVPMPDLLVRLAPAGHADALLTDIKLMQGTDGMTPREAQAAGPHIEAVLGDMRQSLTVEEARALYDAIPADEQVGLKLPIAADLTPEQAKQYAKGHESDQKTTPGRGQNTPEKTAAFAVPKEPEARGAAAEAPERPPDPDAKAIYDVEHQKMLDAGRPEDEAQVFATLRAQNAVAMAKRYGGTPGEWHQRLGELRLVHGGEASAADLLQRGEIRAILGELPPGATMEDLRARLEADAQPENAGAAERFLSDLAPDATMEDVRRWVEGEAPAGALFQAAWHGTPFKGIERFSTEKIGSGQGAQSYGWGLYFAEEPEVAKDYRRMLSPEPDLSIEAPQFGAYGERTTQQVLTQDALRGALRSAIHEEKTPTAQSLLSDGRSELGRRLRQEEQHLDYSMQMLAENKAKGYLQSAVNHANIIRYTERAIEELRGSIALLDTIKPEDLTFSAERPGALYKVDLPEKHELLDYDKPIREQPALVKAAVEKVIRENYTISTREIGRNDVTGVDLLDVRLNGMSIGAFPADQVADVTAHLADHVPWSGGTFYGALSREAGSPTVASKALRDAGIPGLRYLDQVSRGRPPDVRIGGEEMPLTDPRFLAEYYKPGIEVDAYGDKVDTVVSFDPGDAAHSWSVTVRGEDGVLRKHFTTPDVRDLERFANQRGFELVPKGTHNFVIWDDARIKTLETHFQRSLGFSKSDERGFITFEPQGAPGEPVRADLHFLQAADKSTAVHELSHFMLEAMGRISEQPDAPAALTADYETALKEIGYDSHAERQVQRTERLDLAARAERTPEQEARLTELTGKEEAFSHLFETYLAKGTAPSKALASVFARFKEWMRQIYGSIKGIAAQYQAAFGKDLKLSPAMRGVFDRLFAEPKQPQPEGLAAAGARAKEARDFDAAFAAYAAKRIAELKIGEIKPWVYEQQAKVHAVRMMDLAKRLETARQGVVKTKVITPQNHAGEPATYKLVEAQDLITSHSPTGFGPEERYPKGVQERDYLGEQLEQAKVQIEAGRLSPALLLADTPTAVDGPPMVTSGDQAFVLGGNGRSMMLRRAYAEGPAGAAYKEALRQKADAFGIAPEAVDAMKEPVLVRSIDAIQSTAPRAEMAAAVRRFNDGLTQKLSPRLRAVAEARVLTPRTVASIGELLGKGDQSARDLLRSEPQQFLRILERDGVVTDTTRPEWVTGGELTDEAKDRIEGMFLGRVMGSGERLQATAPSMQKKVERAVPALLRVESANPGLSEIGDVQGALDLINDAAHRGMPLEDVLDQRTMFVEGRVEPRTVAMARLFNETNGKEIGRLFKEWAEVAAHDTQGEAQGGMFEKAMPPPTAENALARLFAGRKDDLSGSSRAADNAAPEAAAGAPGETTPTPVEKAADTVSAARIGPQALVRAVAGVLREVQEKHLVADHLARAADAARIEAGKIKEALKANAKDKRRELATKADFEMAEHGADPRPTPYTDGYDAIMESFGFRERSGVPLSADAAVARLEADDRLNFDPDVLKQSLRSSVLAKKPTLDVLTVDEAKTVKSAVTNILQAARAVIEVVRDEQRAQYADDARRIREHAGNRPPPPLPSPSDAGKSGGEGLGRILRAVDAGMLKPEVILRELGPVGEAYAKEMLKARNRADEIQAKVGARIQRAIDSMPAEMRRTRFDGVDGPPVGNGPDGRPLLDPGKWVRQDLMMLFAWAGTESSMARATKGLRITEGQLHQTFDQLTKAEKDFVQRAIWDVNDQVLKPLLLDQTMKSTGVPMETIEAKPITTKDGQYPGGFHHASYNREASKKAAARGAVGEIEGIGDYYGDLKNGWAVGAAKGFTKARAKGFSDIPNLNWSSYGSHVNAVIHYLAVDDFVKSFGGLLRRPDARAAIEASVGAEKLKQLDEGLKVMAQGTVAAPQSGFKIADNILGSLFRNRAAVSAFALNPKTLLMQLTHPLLAAPALRLGPGSLLYGLVHASAGPIASLGNFTAEHLVTGAGKAFDPLSWQAAREASAKWGDNELGFRWDRFTDKMREQFASVGPQGQPGPVLRLLTGGNTAAGETVRGGIAAARQGIDLMNYSMWHVMDGFLSQWIWHARDWKGRQAGEPAEVRAGRNDQAVRDAMPPMTISELSSYARDRGLVGSQLLVKRFPNTMYNLQEIATWQARTKMWESSPGLQRAIAVTGYAANAAATYMAMTFMARFLGQYISGHGRKKDEGETPGQWAIRQWLIGMFEPLPFGTEIATPIVEKVVNKKEITLDAIRRSFHAAPAIGVIEDEIADIGEAWNAHKPLNDRMFAGTRAIIRASSQRLPTQPLTQIQAAIDMARGKYRPKGAIDAAEKFTYGTPKPNQKRATNPFWSIEKRKF